MVRFHLLPPAPSGVEQLKCGKVEKLEREPFNLLTLQPFNFLNGGITQLVECLLCKQNVSGSSPTTSTKSNIFSCLRRCFFDKLQTIEKSQR